MQIKTNDTYEASWYILQGGRVTEIAFGKLQPNKRKKMGFTRMYEITVDNVEPLFINYWKVHNPFGNVRTFSEIRQSLKRKIQKLERQRE